MAGWVARKVKRDFKFRKRSNSVGLNLQEIYLRDDIACGSAACHTCVQTSPRLPANASHYLIPNADALLNFWEVLDLPQVTAVVYLASVVREVQLRSNQRNWRRLRLLFSDKRRRSFYFDDEHCIYSWLYCQDCLKGGVECIAAWLHGHLEGSIPIVVMTGSISSSVETQGNVLAKHFEKGLSFNLSSSDKEAVMVLNAAEYFGHFWSHDTSVTELCSSLIQSQIDMINNTYDEDAAKDEKSGVTTHKEFIYKEHLSANAIEEGITSGALLIGIYHARKQTPDEGFVRPSNKGEASLLEILVPGRKLQNRALHGDQVAVRVISSGSAEKQKSMPPDYGSTIGDIVYNDNNDNTGYGFQESLNMIEDEGGEDLSSNKRHGVIMGEIVGIVQRAQRDYVACLDETEESAASQLSSKRQEQLLCVPMEQRIPLVRVASRQRSRLLGQRFVIRIDGWDKRSKIPSGHVVRVLGPIGDINAENMALLIENDINISPFSSASLQELPEDTEEHPWVIPKEELANRRDLRFSHRAYSIDPPGSKDVDDVLSICEVSDNFLEVGVHIADVSYFVKQDSLLDLEARTRGTTVYLVGDTYHMLPPILSENLCSLRGGQDRLAVSVIWTVDPDNDFEVLNIWFGRTVIRSRHQMFYGQAQAILDGVPLCEGWEIDESPENLAQVQADLCNLASFSKVRRSFRESQGALELSSTELGFDLDEGKEPVDVKTKLSLPMNWIVAELMIFANSCVARRIYESFPHAALLRCHRPPRLDNFSLLFELCEARGYKLDASSNKALADSINCMRDSNDPTIESAFKALAARAMSEAEYISTGEVSESSSFYHYGLALEFYTHFTSPIRRYADIVVHRMLVASCSNTISSQGSVNKRNIDFEKSRTAVFIAKDQKEVADHLNQRHRASKRAQKMCSELHLLMYLQKHAEAECGLVIGIFERNLLVFVPKYDLRGVVQLQNKNGNVILPLDKDETDSDTCNDKVNSNGGKKFRLQYQQQCISIIDSFDNVVHEFKQMTTLWVRMRADGSRARTPSLRMQLLSEKHPASLTAQKQRASLANTTLAFKEKGQVLPRHPHKGLLASNSERRKAILKMVELAASEQSSEAENGMDLEKRDISLNKVTIHEAMEDIEQIFYEVTSVYASFEDGEREQRVVLSKEEEAKVIDNNNGLPSKSLSIYVTLGNSCIKSEEEDRGRLRKLWQKRLSQAAEFRSRQLRANSSDAEEKQKMMLAKEQKARQQAQYIAEHFGLANISSDEFRNKKKVDLL
ncbi:hypothetical protein SUGI_1173790 [Cryptomeria japonica]|uniref:uncharacterized protein LOC131034553 n=1 Tax=Cryptomeria japonica TaxID=3369 RepID=UPI0024148EF4|nr:uncharacterized protein LOC131034553 [Cryptomeria japonica]GLJ54635.1 hypothetical protein SUGI_1173790 [Cryptomeria japonica]